MFTDNPNSTPIWLFFIFGAITALGTPIVKKMVKKYTNDGDKQNLFTFIIMLVIGLAVVTLSMIV